MADKPSIVIGLGTTGSEIVTSLHERLTRLEDKHKIERDLVQFLLVDGDLAPAGAEDLQAAGDCLRFDVPNSQGLVANLSEDAFFRKWWYPGFKRPGAMFPGVGTIPIKGRLGFWATLGRVKFKNAFTNLVAKATDVQRRTGGTFREVDVYVVSTLSGGSGAGMLIDVAFLVRKLRPTGTKIYGVFLLPAVLTLRAPNPKWEQIMANGLATLTALNLWQSKTDRPPELKTFLQYPGSGEVSGDSQPYDLIYLIGRENENGASLQSWPSYKQLIVDALTSEVKAVGARTLDPAQSMDAAETTQKKTLKWASVGVAGLAYYPDRTLDYLARRHGDLAVSYFLSRPEEDVPLAQENALQQARAFLKEWKIREKADETDKGKLDTQVNEVMDKLIDNPEAQEIYAPVDLELELRQTRTDSAAQETGEKLYKQQKSLLEFTVPKMTGIPYQAHMQERRAYWLHRAIHEKYAAATNVGGKIGEQMVGLDARLEQTIREHGLMWGEEFLAKLHDELEAHKQSLLTELNGIKGKGVKGEKEILEEMEDDEYRAIQFNRLRRGGAGTPELRKKWWDQWLEARRGLMLKNQAVQFYKDMQAAIDSRLQSLKDVRNTLAVVQRQLSEEAATFVGVDISSDYVLDDRILAGGNDLDQLIKPDENDANLSQPTISADAFADSKLLIGDAISATLPKLFALGYEDQKAQDARESEMSKLAARIEQGLKEKGKKRFEKQADISVWKALAIEAKLNGAQTNAEIVKYVTDRIQYMVNRCAPFWPLSQADLQAKDIQPQAWAVFDYDTESKQAFEKEYNDGKILNLDSVLAGKLEQTLQQGALEQKERWRHVDVSTEDAKYVFRISFYRGSVPLEFLSDIPELVASFEAFHRKYGDAAPVYTDYRYEKLPPIGKRSEDDRYYFLLAEYMDKIKSPIKRLRVAGNITLGSIPLGTNREQAFDSLKIGGQYHSEFQEVIKQVQSDLDEMSPEEQKATLLRCYSLLNSAALRAGGVHRERLDNDCKVIADRLYRSYNISSEDIAKQCRARKIEFETVRPSSSPTKVAKATRNGKGQDKAKLAEAEVKPTARAPKAAKQVARAEKPKDSDSEKPEEKSAVKTKGIAATAKK